MTGKKTQGYLKELFELLSIPTISAQSKHNSDMKKASTWLKKRLTNISFESRILSTSGQSVVYAENLKAGKDRPTVLVYGHYDVQDSGNLKEWSSEPFKPVIRSGNIYARGASDDKGQLYTWIATLQLILDSGKKFPVNIKFLIEGEEEMGSANLEEFVVDNKSLLQADVCLISDSHCLSEEQPLIDYGLRGLLYVQLLIKTLGKDGHSGLYGGNVLNPINVLSQVIAQLKDKNHKILIPEFYDKVRKISRKEADELAKFPFHEKEVMEETGAKVVVGEKGFGIHARAGARPTLDINGIWGGYQGEGVKTIIPAEAHAKISMRLVPYQNPNQILVKLENYLKKIMPKGVEYSVSVLSTDEAIIMNTKSIYFSAAKKAYKKVFGKDPLYGLSGGSIPITAILKRNLDMDSILMGYGLPDDGLHSPNEKLSLAMFKKGIATNLEFLKQLSI